MKLPRFRAIQVDPLACPECGAQMRVESVRLALTPLADIAEACLKRRSQSSPFPNLPKRAEGVQYLP